ncbi:NAD-dependent epimerase/dehydratase family protein [Rhodococcoides fascians]|uniref:NAD-dependent epimerase/dehydratase family protein n=1 Tax=Rhodococcoides fascians TaxID=1828 RepID=UPI000563B44F|nr:MULTISPECIES: NAD-dependent epimerase/dehydratase family protein [Rhodococcus]OZF07315.1 epimerase [Rhodococcus sp. 15-1189-1-1a]OZF22840.1 epimerase [Rhodococcus sp. 14-2686-1-2]
MTLRIAVTGATSDFAAAILPSLLADDDVDSVVGIARRPLRMQHSKLESVRADIRSPRLEEIFQGCDVVIHLAFVVEELRDKTETHDINQRGSRNVLDSAYAAGVGRLVITSSINAYGADIHDKPLDESHYPAGDPDRYYFHDKAEVEHYAEWWLRRHPGEMAVSMLRPTYIIGPDFANDGIDQFTGRVGAFPQADRASYQFLHQNDLADAFHRAAKQDLIGPYNVGPRDWTPVRELARMQGQILFDVPEKPAVAAANLAFRLGLTPFSGQWVTAGEPVVDSTALSEKTGWTPTLTSHECAAVMVLLQGKPILGAEHALTSQNACEAALEPASRFVGTVGGEHVSITTTSGRLHIELHRGSAQGPTVVVPVRPGLHARYLTPVAQELAHAGITTVLLDLPGHGLSTGPRGRVTAAEFDDAVANAADYARLNFGSTVAVVDIGDHTPAPKQTLRRLRRHHPVNPADGLLPRRLRAHDLRGRTKTRTTTATSVDEVIDLVGGAAEPTSSRAHSSVR